MRLRRVVTGVVVAPLAFLGLGLAAGTAAAATTTVPMTGEFLSNLPPAQTVSGTCNPDGSGTVTFTVSGTAAGPYSGTFTESGTATFGPAVFPIETAPGQFRSELLSFSADFTIDSALGVVTGHKELPDGAGSPAESGNAATCFTAFDGVYSQIVTNRLVYTATTPTGDDSGTTFVNMNTAPNPVANSSSLQFREGFSSPNPAAPQCSNGVDDDGDGLTDYPADPGCTSPADNTESPNPAPQCSNGVDDDGDGLTDYPADPGCTSPDDNTESPNPAPQCSNGVDDDGDGLTDYPADPGCTSPEDNTESPNPAPPGPATVTLTPPDAVNDVGTSHTVTATVDNISGGPVADSTVLFSVQGSVTTTGSCTTGADGTCTFTYQGPSLPGADLITGCADANSNGAVDVGEPCGTATKAWILPATTAGQTTGGGQVAAGADKIAFGFTAKSDSKGVKGECSVVDPTTGAKVKCLDVTALVQSGNHATFFGNATVNGVATTYRIDVQDNAEPGRGTDTFTIQTASGYSAGGVLTAGNIQVH